MTTATPQPMSTAPRDRDILVYDLNMFGNLERDATAGWVRARYGPPAYEADITIDNFHNGGDGPEGHLVSDLHRSLEIELGRITDDGLQLRAIGRQSDLMHSPVAWVDAPPWPPTPSPDAVAAAADIEGRIDAEKRRAQPWEYE
jgi:hypothetical protein